ncbi:hydrogenase nickel incorporation protein HypB [Streptomyces sp. TRM 70361]|uniref:hydrogenase nickel incorporation protein HypB n=1 Tax=Streptomyces sp. TRM 70361 TaxID=3116553 RepID=UPI002E7BAD79|nr:hydrogenase nickel incorporation protein HypB [Streptomyces sp. TRM 70361]MEE1940196.1 hydrogenase nickel incorporation protein HypB [Streptomyces sp. TRM 70361]
MCRTVDLKQAVLAKNDRLADTLRAWLSGRGTAAVNLLSSPGSGKTALLELLLARAAGRGVPVAALTADLATENDARRLARSGAPVKQVLTGGLCHLEAEQLRGHLAGWLPDGTRVLFVENVGNLVCPAAYDLGETLRVALMSVTEGEDKPLKYPTAFGLANLVVLTKTDLARAAGFDAEAFAGNVRQVNPGVAVLPTCARTGRGADELLERILAVCEGEPPHRPPLAARHLDEHRHDHAHPYDHGHAPGVPHPETGPGPGTGAPVR